ncbi:MAG: hypothetical protein ABIH69_04815 [bacterium]
MTGNTSVDMLILFLLIALLVAYNIWRHKNKEEEKSHVLSNVECSFCHGKDLDTKRPLKTQGWILIIVGLFFVPAFGLGILIILWGLTMKENKFYCNKCKRAF